MLSVLYVDDEPALLDIARIFLEMSGKIRLETAQSAGEAAGLLEHREYDGIVSDYEMPGISGIDFLRHIRLNYPDLPFILFTGRGREEIAIEALNSGADFYLQKGGNPKVQFAELEYHLLHAIERRKAREELRESRQLMANLIDFLPDATFAIDRENRVISWNRMMEKLTGAPASDMIGTSSYREIFSRLNGQRLPLVDIVSDPGRNTDGMDLVRDENALISEFYSPDAYGGKGAHLWLIASPLYNAGGNVIGAIESIRDVSRRIEAEKQLKTTHGELEAAYGQLTATEEELRHNYEALEKSRAEISRSEERYRNIVEDQTELICRFTPGGVLTFANVAYCRYFGLDPRTCTGKPHPVRIPKEDQDLMDRYLAQFSPAHAVDSVEHRIVLPDGTVRWQRWSDRAVFGPGGRIAEYQSVGRDITESKHLEQALYEANRKLTLLSSITRHDILNQLTALHGYLDLIDAEVTDPGTRMLAEQAKRCSEVIHDQISFTRQYESVGTQMPFWQDVYTAATDVSCNGGFRMVDVDASLSGTEIYADPLLKLIFYNLFENAWMHGGRGVKVQVSGTVTNGRMEIVITDNGRGILPEDKEKIFVKGFGTHTGLGLYLVREILLITEITISENGEYGRGARFVISVPAGRFRRAAAKNGRA